MYTIATTYITIQGNTMAFFEYKPISPLYHYCGPESFEGIIKSGAMWLTDLQHLNDPKELQLIDIIDKLILELSQNPKTTPNLRRAYQTLIPRLQGVRPHLGLYSFSLSLKGEQLPMWQEYTARGRGYCIGFKATAFNDMSLRVQKVEYASQDSLSSIGSKIEGLVRPLVGMNLKPNQIELHTTEPIATVIRLLCLASSTKDDIWAHEQEVRLVFSSSPVLPKLKPVWPFEKWTIGMLPDGSPMVPEEPSYRQRNGQSVPYHVKPFGQWRDNVWNKSGSIAEVILGCNNLRSVEDVERELFELGYTNVKVTNSKCNFRP